MSMLLMIANLMKYVQQHSNLCIIGPFIPSYPRNLLKWILFRSETQSVRHFVIFTVRCNKSPHFGTSATLKDLALSSYEVQIWNKNKLIKTLYSNEQETIVSLTSLPKDFYIAKVIKNGKNYTKNFFIRWWITLNLTLFAIWQASSWKVQLLYSSWTARITLRSQGAVPLWSWKMKR